MHSSLLNTLTRSWYSLGMGCVSLAVLWQLPSLALGLPSSLPAKFVHKEGRGPLASLIFCLPPSHHIMGLHLSSHASPRIIDSVILGMTVNQIISQCWAISSLTDSIKWVAATPPSREPSTCLNLMELDSLFARIPSLTAAGKLIKLSGPRTSPECRVGCCDDNGNGAGVKSSRF